MRNFSHSVKAETLQKYGKSTAALKRKVKITKPSQSNFSAIRPMVGTRLDIRNPRCLDMNLETTKLKMLCVFKTYPGEDIYIRSGEMRFISSIPKYINSLKTFDLSFLDCCRASSHQFDLFCSNLKLLTSLTSLKVGFPLSTSASNINLKSFAVGLKNLKRLSSLTICMNHSQTSAAKGIRKLFLALRSLCSLTSLTLENARCGFNADKDLRTLSQGIKNLRTLTSLKLDFSYCYKVTDVGVREFSSGFKRLRSLSELDINLQGCDKIKDEGVQALSDALENLETLTCFRLKFEFKRISDQVLLEFSTKLNSLKRLSELSLDNFMVHIDTPEGSDDGSDGIVPDAAGVENRNGNLFIYDSTDDEIGSFHDDSSDDGSGGHYRDDTEEEEEFVTDDSGEQRVEAPVEMVNENKPKDTEKNEEIEPEIKKERDETQKEAEPQDIVPEQKDDEKEQVEAEIAKQDIVPEVKKEEPNVYLKLDDLASLKKLELKFLGSDEMKELLNLPSALRRLTFALEPHFRFYKSGTDL